jgi:protein-disulfide isomerase
MLTPQVTAKDHIEGPAEAPVTLVEFGDYECPSCGDAFPIVERIRKHFGDKLRFVFRNFPLPMHPHAEAAAETAEFAAARGKFWQMHSLLYKHQDTFSTKNFLAMADQLDLPTEELEAALKTHTYRTRIQQDIQSGDKSGVTGTPMFYINGKLHEEDYDYDTLVAAIEASM